MFCKSGILIFIFAENNYSIYAHAMLIKTPLLHQSFGPRVFLSFFLSLAISGWFPGARKLAACNPGNISLYFFHSLNQECPLISIINKTTKSFLILHFYIFASMLINKISLYFNPLKSSLNVSSVNITLITNNVSVSFLYFSIIWKSLCKTRIAFSFTVW